MTNPWLEIPLADYEAHMALPEVAQAVLLADIFADLLTKYRPRSVAVLGCAGGNGLERIANATTGRVVAVDLNPRYVERLRARFQKRIPKLEATVGDIQGEDVSFAPVELAYAALLLEYVDVGTVLQRMRSLLTEDGLLATLVQLPDSALPAVTPSPFPSIQALAPFMRYVPPERLRELAEKGGYREISSWQEKSSGGKRFQAQIFRPLSRDRPIDTEKP